MDIVKFSFVDGGIHHIMLKFKVSIHLFSVCESVVSYWWLTVDLVYKRKVVGRNDYLISSGWQAFFIRRTRYNTNSMRRTAFLVVNPVTGKIFASIFNCTPAGRVPGLGKSQTQKRLIQFVVVWCSVFGWAHRGPTNRFLLLQWFRVGLAVLSSHLLTNHNRT